MKVSIFEEIYDYADSIIKENKVFFPTETRYAGSLSKAEKAMKMFLLIYDKIRHFDDGYGSAEVHRDVFYMITRRNTVTEELIKGLMKTNLITVQKNHGEIRGVYQSKKYRLGIDVWKRYMEIKKSFNQQEISVEIPEINLNKKEDLKNLHRLNYLKNLDNSDDLNGLNISKDIQEYDSNTGVDTIEMFHEGTNDSKTLLKTIVSGTSREPFQQNCDENDILTTALHTSTEEENPREHFQQNMHKTDVSHNYLITEKHSREDLEIYKEFELDHNLLWNSQLSFDDKIKLEKIVSHHVPAKQCDSGKSFRLSHWIHQLPKVYRKFITLHGSHITEIWDKSCCYPSMLGILCKERGVNEYEIKRYIDLVQNGDIYSEALKMMNKEVNKENRDIIKPYFQRFIQGKSEAVEKIINSEKEKIFVQDKGYIYPELLKGVSEFYRKKFPNIYNQVMFWEVRKDKTKTISTECSRLEKELIQETICTKIPCDWFTVHDAIFIREADLPLIKDINFDMLFWDAAGFETIDML